MRTINRRNVTFDSAKDRINTERHGLSLELARRFEWDSALMWQDERFDYDEDRMVALGYIGPRLHCVVFVDRPDGRRIISLRKANTREVKRYAEA